MHLQEIESLNDEYLRVFFRWGYLVEVFPLKKLCMCQEVKLSALHLIHLVKYAHLS